MTQFLPIYLFAYHLSHSCESPVTKGPVEPETLVTLKKKIHLQNSRAIVVSFPMRDYRQY